MEIKKNAILLILKTPGTGIRRKMPTIQEILFEIRHLNDENSIQRWITNGLTSLTPDLLEKAIMEWQDPLLVVEYLNLDNTLIKIIAKIFIKNNWDRIEPIFTDKWLLYNHISKDLQKKQLLDTPKGREWLSYVRRRCYSYFYKYAWE
ncbi:MAG: hypothetical protein PHZ02_01275 [Desulfocapsaceae bacterium]|nr:hypothetical protein [Desulfocapsaceae bacterium]